jgi:lipopolysaccharide transport system ATP-binding protein
MHLRLAFAVAAHLEPEILLVDEVLAVGDASFQRKCLGKMSDVAHSGRTVLFVSHNMEAVQRLCPRTVWIDGGELVEDGPTDRVISSYLESSTEPAGSVYRMTDDASSDRSVLVRAELLDSAGEPGGSVRFGEPFAVRMVWENRAAIPGAFYFVQVDDDRGRLISATNHRGEDLDVERPGRHEVVCRVESNVLVPGDYTLSIGCFQRPKTFFHHVPHCLRLQVLEVAYDRRLGSAPEGSLVAMPSTWSRSPAP